MKKSWLIAGGVLLAVVVVASIVLKPWLLFIDTRVDDVIAYSTTAPKATSGTNSAAPVSDAMESPSSDAPESSTSETPASDAPETPAPETPALPTLVSSGQFISHEHQTTGTASIVRQPDGSHQLILENLATSNGPDVHVWLSQGPVVEGTAGWTTAKDYPHLDIAPLKGNLGNQVYNLPQDFDPAQWPTVDLWCDDFSVSFGAAALSPR